MKIIAELGASHNGSIEVAQEIIRTVVADIFKLQYWTPGEMAVSHVLDHGAWKGRDLVELYEEAHTPLDWFPTLFDDIKENNMVPMVTVFDAMAFHAMEEVGCPMYKVASYEAVDLDLVELIAKAGKPMAISTGQMVFAEMERVIEHVKQWNDNVTLMHCVSRYPAPTAGLGEIYGLMNALDCDIGYSDHTEGVLAPILAAQLGATLIEKHVCLDGAGLDAAFALPVDQFSEMYGMCHAVDEMMAPAPEPDMALRRSLYYNTELQIGATVKPWHLVTRRPNLGVSPLEKTGIIGKQLNRAVQAGDPVKMYHLD